MTSRQQATIALHRIAAIEAATGHLVLGVNAICHPGWEARRGAPALLNIAMGVERIAKNTIGTIVEADTGAFPSDGEMRDFGHRISALLTEVHARICEQAERHGDSYIENLAAVVDADPYWHVLVGILETSASANHGRYVHERALAGQPPVGELASGMWDELDRIAIGKLGLWGRLGGDDHREILTRVRTEAMTGVVRWWVFVFRSWQRGMAGNLGRQFSAELGLYWSDLPTPLDHLASSI